MSCTQIIWHCLPIWNNLERTLFKIW